MTDFFSARAPSDPAYVAARDCERFADVRSHLRSLWAKFKRHADKHFLEEIGRQFQPRYWEMRLGCTLLDLGFVLAPARARGPDFDASTPGGDPLYIEAIAVGPGEGADAVPEPSYGAEEAEVYPAERIVLRIRSAIATKLDQHAAHIDGGLIAPSAPYVVAVNIGGIPRAFVAHNPPTLAQACLGVGSLMVAFGPAGTSEVALGGRDTIRKASGSAVNTRIFSTGEYSWLSGVLLSDVSAFRLPVGVGDFQFLHNPQARHPLRRGWFPVGSEHWCEGSTMHNRWPDDVNA